MVIFLKISQKRLKWFFFKKLSEYKPMVQGLQKISLMIDGEKMFQDINYLQIILVASHVLWLYLNSIIYLKSI